MEVLKLYKVNDTNYLIKLYILNIEVPNFHVFNRKYFNNILVPSVFNWFVVWYNLYLLEYLTVSHCHGDKFDKHSCVVLVYSHIFIRIYISIIRYTTKLFGGGGFLILHPHIVLLKQCLIISILVMYKYVYQIIKQIIISFIFYFLILINCSRWWLER